MLLESEITAWLSSQGRDWNNWIGKLFSKRGRKNSGVTQGSSPNCCLIHLPLISLLPDGVCAILYCSRSLPSTQTEEGEIRGEGTIQQAHCIWQFEKWKRKKIEKSEWVEEAGRRKPTRKEQKEDYITGRDRTFEQLLSVPCVRLPSFTA